MAITFKRAPTVAAGDPITSTQFAALADAFNDRLRSGIGDGPYRIQQLYFNLCRQFRNPDANGLSFPALAEWQELYIHLDPSSGWEYPEADAGDFEGANLSSLLPAFVFGNPSTTSESDRLSIVDLNPGAGTIEEYWNLGKRQRGGYDPATGNQWVPALTAAQDYFRIVQPQGSFHGKSYGAYFPLPVRLGDCGDQDHIPNFQYRFTSLVAGVPDKVYPGSCPSWTPGFDPSHVQGIWSGPLAYYVFLGSGAVDRLPKDQYIEGPYSAGGGLSKRDGDQLPRLVLNPFIREYRGTAVQRIGEYDIRAIAFDFQEFLTSQYLLAPARASMDGSQLDITYPVLTFSSTAEGSLSTTHTIAAEFVLGGVLVKASGLSAPVSLTVLDGSSVLANLSLAPDPDNKASAVQFWTTGPKPQDLKLRLNDAAPGATITMEVAELLESKPQHHDAYLILRMASALPILNDVDRRGIDEGQSAKIWQDYARLGCIVPQNGAVAVEAQTANIQTNAPYDAARRLVRKHTRIVRRQQFVGYELDAQGRSVLYFRKHAYGLDDADSFSEISDAIAHTAPTKGRTNEWLMFIQTKTYNPNAGTVFWTSSYSDYFAWNNRCHFWSPWINGPQTPDMLRHVTQGPPYPDQVVAPEAPTGYNYAENTNRLTTVTTAQREAFYKSCQIYAPDYEIESAESIMDDGQETVKITFTGRLRHTDSAPGTIARNPNSWDVNALRAEPYRTDENALREYLVAQAMNLDAPVKTGDTAAPFTAPTDGPLNSVGTLHPMYGSVFPHFFFTKLVPKPYDDGNDDSDPTDTVCDVDDYLQMEIYLRAMCEGYVDGVTSASYACQQQVETVFDYNFENMCFQAFGGRWLTVFPEAERPDNPQGFGPLPNTIMYADVFNQYSACVNLLTQARVMLPHRLEVFQRDYTGQMSAAMDVGTASKGINFGQAPPGAGTDVFPESWEWVGADNAVSTAASSYDGTVDGGGVPILKTVRTAMDWRFTLTDPLSLNAIPESWRDGYAALGGGFVARREHLVSVGSATTTTGPASDCAGSVGFWNIGGTDYLVQDILNTTESCEVFPAAGTIDVGTPPTADFAYGSVPPSFCRTVSEHSTGIFPVSTQTGILTVALI